MPNTYLFIPFEEKENNKELLQMAERWVDAQVKHKSQLCEILVYKEDQIPLLKKGDQIYILAHGVPKGIFMDGSGADIDVVANTAEISSELEKKLTATSGVQVLTPEILAARMVESGLTPQPQTKVKLYFCDESQRAKEIATSFMSSLVKENKDFTKPTLGMSVSYYSGILSAPMTKTPEGKEIHLKDIHKQAARVATPSDSKRKVIQTPRGDFVYLGRASSVKTTLFFNMPGAESKKKAKDIHEEHDKIITKKKPGGID